MTKKQYDISITMHYFVEAETKEEAMDLFTKAKSKSKTFPSLPGLINIQEMKEAEDLTTTNILNLIKQ